MQKKIATIIIGILISAFPILATAQNVDSSDNSALIASLTALVQALQLELKQLIVQKTSGTAVAANTHVSDDSAPKTLAVSATSLVFPTSGGISFASSSSIVLTNNSDQSMVYSVGQLNNPSWLNIQFDTETHVLQSGQHASVPVSVNASGLPAGVYSATLVIQGDFSTSPIDIPITLTVGVQQPESALVASCQGKPFDSGIGVGWSVTPSGGNGSYSFNWTFGNDMTNTVNMNTSTYLPDQEPMVQYASRGTKNATVVVQSGDLSVTASCSASIGAPPPILSSITPAMGSTNTAITLYGQNLAGATSIEFDHYSNGNLGTVISSTSSNLSISETNVSFLITNSMRNSMGPDTYNVVVKTPSGFSNPKIFVLK